MYLDDFSDGSVAWLLANTKAVVPLTTHAGGRLGMAGATRAAVHPMRNCVHRLVTTSFRLLTETPFIPVRNAVRTSTDTQHKCQAN